jgi:hypothetical protein
MRMREPAERGNDDVPLGATEGKNESFGDHKDLSPQHREAAES